MKLQTEQNLSLQ